MNIGQLIEYNMRDIFLKNHAQNKLEKLFADHFLKNHNCVYLWISRLNFCTV